MLVFRLGDRKYRVSKTWAKLPDNIPLGSFADLTIDRDGNILVFHRGEPFMLVFSPRGELLAVWRDQSISDAHYLRALADGRILAVDRDHHRVVILNASGETTGVIGDAEKPGQLGTPLNHPTDVAVNAAGDFFIADGYGNSNVHHFDRSGVHVKSWGRPGSGAGEFTTPHSIVMRADGRLLVSDRENNRIQIFDEGGAYHGEIGGFYHPMKLFADRDGYTYVTDQIPRLLLIDPAGRLAGMCRTLGNPHGMAVAENGDIYLAEMMPDALVRFERIS